MLHNICTYGLFRKDQGRYNYMQAMFGNDSIFYIKTIKLPGYKMYDCIFNPTIERTLNQEDFVIVDLLRVTDKAYEEIEKIDSGGKFFEEFISIDDIYYSIFIEIDIGEESKISIVEDGDWTKV